MKELIPFLFRGCVEVLVECGANISVQDKKGNTALMLHTASAWAQPHVVKLLSVGWNSNISSASRVLRIPNYAGSYPILEVMKSTTAHRDEVLKVIINQNSPLDVTTSEGSTPLHLACCSSAWNSAMMLVRAGAKMDICDSLGRSVLFIALQNGQFRLANAMLAAGAVISTSSVAKLSPECQLYLKKSRTEVPTLKHSVRK